MAKWLATLLIRSGKRMYLSIQASQVRTVRRNLERIQVLNTTNNELNASINDIGRITDSITL